MIADTSSFWTKQRLEEVLSTSVVLRGENDFVATRVEVMPSQCRPGVLFVATPRSNGDSCPTEVVRRALGRGAVAAVTPQGAAAALKSGAIWEVRNPEEALTKMAHAARGDFAGQVIAVTGSVGKTTTTSFIHHMLKAVGRSHLIESGGRNSWRGIISAPPCHDFCVVEAGVGRPGRMKPKAAFIRPHVAILTNVGISHAEYYSDYYEILRNKAVLFDYLEGPRVAIVCRSALDLDNSRERLIKSKSIGAIVAVGDESDDVGAVRVDTDGRATWGQIHVYGRYYSFWCPLPGRHLVNSVLFSVACMAALGQPVEAGIEALASITPLSGRIERWSVQLREGTCEIINDCKNAAPASVNALLDVIAARRDAKRKILVLGDMRELGSNSPVFHKDLAPKVAYAGIDLVVTVGPLAKLMADHSREVEVRSVEDANSALKMVQEVLLPGDLVAVKGSAAVGLKRVVDGILSAHPSHQMRTLPPRIAILGE